MPTVNHPLENVRVIDLGRHQAGPRCAQVLARMGAEVIKVERLGGEETRYHGPWVKKQSSYWVQYNSGKKSLSMDLRKEEGKEVLRELIKVSDVLVQNFRPGTIEKMGFGYDVLKELNPRIIMVNVSAYGQFGPYSDNIGYDPIGQTMSGITMVTGEEGMPPIRTGVPIIDRITSLHAAIGTLAALHEREISGLGQSMDVCLADTGYSMTEIPITAYHGTEEINRTLDPERLNLKEYPKTLGIDARNSKIVLEQYYCWENCPETGAIFLVYEAVESVEDCLVSGGAVLNSPVSNSDEYVACQPRVG